MFLVKMHTFFTILLILFVTTHVLSQDPIISSPKKGDSICDTCKCINGTQFILDCRLQKFQHIPTKWPNHTVSLAATFSYNNITTLEVLPKSDHVKQLIFDNCGIVSIENGAFADVKNLKFLDLSHNLLTTEELSSNTFKGPYNNSVYEPLPLKHLNLAHNKLHSLPHKIFEHLGELEELILEGNGFKVLDHPTQIALSGLPNLQRLDLSHNQLTDLPPDAIQKMTRLIEIDLSDNLLDFVPDTLSLLGKTLESVNLDNNLIFEITDESFLGLKNVIEISMTNLPRLEFVKANAFAGLPQLKILKLSDNPNLTGIDKEAFLPNQTLEELYFHNNSLRGLDIHLTNWASLRVLSLYDNPLICNCALYEIVRNLNWEIRRAKDGASCTNPVTLMSEQVYGLKKDICGYEANSYGVHLIEDNFQTFRVILLIVSVVMSISAAVVVAILFLRYRRYKLNRNYPFTTQVMYNPLRTPQMPI